MYMFSRRAVLLCSILFLASTHVASAASVSWSSNHPTLRGSNLWTTAYGNGGVLYTSPYWHVMSSPMTTVIYNAYVYNADTGAVVPPNSTVPKGTRLRFEFSEGASSDLSWFGTGSYNDSPYGSWVNDASQFPGTQCRPEDKIDPAPNLPSNVLSGQFARLTVEKPNKSISGISSFSCTAGSGGNQNCTAATAGVFTPVFNFGATEGSFWASSRSASNHSRTWDQVQTAPNPLPNPMPQCSALAASDRDGWCYGGRGTQLMHYGCFANFTPMQLYQGADAPYTVQVPAQVISYPITVVDGPNTAPASPTISAGGSCTVDSPYTLTFSATDSDGDTLRYLIDWDNDGSADQIVPPTGYVSSGSVQTASRTFTLPGTKTIKVLAEDSKGALSAWKTHTAECTEAPVDEDGEFDGDGGDGDGGGALPPAATMSIRAMPSLVRQGETTLIRWEASGVSSCSITGSNGDALPASGETLPVPGEATTSAIRAQTTYTLSCTEAGTGNTETAIATVNVLPVFQEN